MASPVPPAVLVLIFLVLAYVLNLVAGSIQLDRQIQFQKAHPQTKLYDVQLPVTSTEHALNGFASFSIFIALICSCVVVAFLAGGNAKKSSYGQDKMMSMQRSPSAASTFGGRSWASRRLY